MDAKFYAIHASPSAKELQAMGNTEQEQSEAMKRCLKVKVKISLDANVQIGKDKSIDADINIGSSADLSQSNNTADLGLSSDWVFSPLKYMVRI